MPISEVNQTCQKVESDPHVGSMRIDQWLWGFQVFKGTSLDTEASSRGQVSMNGKGLRPEGARHFQLSRPGEGGAHMSGNPNRPRPAEQKEPDWWDNSNWWGDPDLPADFEWCTPTPSRF